MQQNKREFLRGKMDKNIEEIEYWKELAEKLQKERDYFQKELDEAKMLYPRAMKLIGKKKDFLVVACDEPYFRDVYQTIRFNEIRNGRWNSEDEGKYLDAIAKTEE